MATETLTVDEQALRLQALSRICCDIATAINGARGVLRSNAEDPAVSHLVADALDRAGWMADRATVLAGEKSPQIVGAAEDWLLDSALNKLLSKIEGEVAHG